MRIEYLYRYPVKGLTAEALEAAEVEAGGCIPWDRAFALAQGDSGFDPAAAALAAEDKLHVPDEERPHRRAVLVLRAAHRHAGDPRARRLRGGGERADRGRARADRRLPDRLSGRGGARHAALPPRPGPQLLRPAPQGGQPDQPGQPARLRGEGRRAPAPPAVPRQCLVQRRAGVERARLGRPADPGRRRGAAGDQADHPLRRRPR